MAQPIEKESETATTVELHLKKDDVADDHQFFCHFADNRNWNDSSRRPCQFPTGKSNTCTIRSTDYARSDFR